MSEMTMSDTDNYKLSFDYRLEYAVYEQRDYLCRERAFVSRDPNEAFTRMLTMAGDAQRTLRLELKDPEGHVLYYRELASYGKEVTL